MRLRFFTIIASLAVAISLAALFVSPAHAEPPYTQYGTGLSESNVVDVYVEGRYCDSAVADAAGNWGPVAIWDTSLCAPEPGDVITFLLNTQPTNETEIWAPGGAPANVATGTVLTLDEQGFPFPLQPGINLTTWDGVSLDQLLTHAAAQACVVNSFWVTISPNFVVFISGAPDHVNQEMRDTYPGGMPPGTVVLVACGTSGSVAQAPFIAYGTGLAEDDEVGVWVGNTQCVTTAADPTGDWGPLQIAATTGPCTLTQGTTISFALNGLRANETEVFAPGGHPADVANGTALTADLDLEASLGHDWIEGRTLLPGHELTLKIYASQGGLPLGTFIRAADGAGTVRWTVADTGIDLLPDMHVVLSRAGTSSSMTMRSVSLGQWNGGTIGDFAAAAWSVDAPSFYIEDGGFRVVYVIGAPAFVNQAFIDAFSPSFEATAPEVGVSAGDGTLWAPLYESALAPVYIVVPACIAEGRVINSDDGQPIEGVTIGLYRWSENIFEIEPVITDADTTDAGGQFAAPCDGIAADLFPLVVTLARSDWWGTAITGVLVPFGGASGLEIETSVCSSTRSTEDALILDEIVGEGPTRLLTIEPRGNTVGYDFEAGASVGGASGDFYFNRCGEPEFWANNWFSPWFQNGVLDLGDLGEAALDDITPPADGYWKWGVPAIVGHTYVARTRGESATDHVIFRVLEVETTDIAVTSYVLEYYFREAPPPPPPAPPPVVLPLPRFEPTLIVVNDDGGTAVADDFTVLLDDNPVELETTITVSIATHTVAVEDTTPFYDVAFSAACAEGTFSAVPGSLVNCTITLDDLPLTAVLGAPLPGSEALIDESLSLAADAFNLNGQTVVQASSAGTPPEITVIVPVEALPGDSDITVTVLPANELAIGETPPPGTLLIGGTAYVISITDALGEPITSFQLPITLSFALPEGADVTPLVAYVFDEASELWTVQPGAVVDGRYVATPSHLTTFGLFEFQGSGGFTHPLPSAGVALSTAEGGTFLQLEQALQQADAISAFVSQAGVLIGYVPEAPAFVNQDFVELLGGAIPPGQLMIVVLGD